MRPIRSQILALLIKKCSQKNLSGEDKDEEIVMELKGQMLNQRCRRGVGAPHSQNEEQKTYD